MNNRQYYLDTVRFLACTLVFVNHFCVNVGGQYAFLWSEAPYRFFFQGFNGKLAVGLFAVVLGLLASSSGQNSKYGVLEYAVRRYIGFFAAGLVGNVFYCLCRFFFAGPDGTDFLHLSLNILKQSLILGDGFLSILWCLKEFYLGSVISYIFGKYRLDVIPELFFTALFLLIGKHWIAVCLLGAVLSKLQSYCDSFPSAVTSRAFRASLPALSFLLILAVPVTWRFYHFITGVIAFLFMFAVINSEKMISFFTPSGNSIRKICALYMAFFVINESVYTFFPYSFISLFGGMQNGSGYFLSLIICFFITILFSFPADYAIRFLQNAGNRLFSRITACFPEKGLTE